MEKGVSTLNLGAGNRPLDGAVNHDRRKHRVEIDIAWDLNKLPWPWEDGEFDWVHAMSVLEHLDIDLLQSIDECWRILVSGGRLRVRVPYWRHETCWRDPTHRRGYTMDTFDIFDPTTKAGREYDFYTVCKWEVVERRYIYLSYDTSSIASSLEVVMRRVDEPLD